MPKPKKKKAKLSPLALKAEKALQEAVRKLIIEHRFKKIPVYVWKNGKVVQLRFKGKRSR